MAIKSYLTLSSVMFKSFGSVRSIFKTRYLVSVLFEPTTYKRALVSYITIFCVQLINDDCIVNFYCVVSIKYSLFVVVTLKLADNLTT